MRNPTFCITISNNSIITNIYIIRDDISKIIEKFLNKQNWENILIDEGYGDISIYKAFVNKNDYNITAVIRICPDQDAEFFMIKKGSNIRGYTPIIITKKDIEKTCNDNKISLENVICLAQEEFHVAILQDANGSKLIELFDSPQIQFL